MKALKYLLVKEYKQMFRNRILPVVFVLVPFVMINIVPRITTQEISNINIAVIDSDHSTLSSRMIHKISSSKCFNLYATCNTYKEAYELMKLGNIDLILTIEPDFERKLYRENASEIMVSVNAVNGMKGALGSGYLTQIAMLYADELRAETGFAAELPLKVEPRYMFNQTLDYKVYMVPALMLMSLILLVGFLPALNVVSEKERGTIEQINVTPISRMEFILSKMVPYWTIGIFIILFSMFLAWKIHGIVPAGSIALIFLFITVFIILISSFALVVSNYSDNFRQAAFVMFFFVVIFMLTSGLISPVSSMPEWAQILTLLNPMRYIVSSMRDIYLKGSELTQLLPQFIPLCIYTLATSIWAIISYRKKE